MKINVEKLAKPVHSGDWHDKPLKWSAVGPGDEVQLFQTKKNALTYASIRRKSRNKNEAEIAYLKA